MKLSEIRAAIKAKANSTNIEQPFPTAPEPIVKPKPGTTPVQSIPAEQQLKQPKRESRTKTFKSADNFITEDIETIIGK